MIELEKPKVGDPCNGCGLCCKAEICANGSLTLMMRGEHPTLTAEVRKYGDRAKGPCPALVEKDDSLVCEMVLLPKKWAPVKGAIEDRRRAFKMLIGSGAGCDELADDEDPEELEAVLQRVLSAGDETMWARAQITWFGQELMDYIK